MKILLDTNVILDYMLGRNPFFDNALKILDLASYENQLTVVSSSAITDIFYHVNRAFRDSFITQDKIEELMQIISVLDVTEDDIRRALSLRWKDFEDAVQYSVAVSNHVDFIITRNASDFESRDIPVMNPEEFLLYLGM